jgi:hypothetical protein
MRGTGGTVGEPPGVKKRCVRARICSRKDWLRGIALIWDISLWRIHSRFVLEMIC